jgi:hypothetical protein
MSATLDAASFVRYFPGARAAYVQGRQHPVSVLYTREHVPNYHEAAITTTLQVGGLGRPHLGCPGCQAAVRSATWFVFCTAGIVAG